MFCGYRNVELIRLVCFSLTLTGVTTEKARRSPPVFKIIEEGNDLCFQGSPLKLNKSTHCWKYMFQYSKCKETLPLTINVTEKDNWTAKVEYDSACKYTVQARAIYDTQNCGVGEGDSNMSSPMYFGQDGNPNFRFEVAMIAIPVMVCFSLIIAIVLFRRHKDKVFPKVPSPSLLFSDMFDSKKEMIKGLYIGKLYVPNEEVVEEICVEPKIRHSF